MKFLSASPLRDHKICRFQNGEMLGHGLTRHIHLFTKRVQRLPVPGMKAVQQASAAGIGERPETQRPYS